MIYSELGDKLKDVNNNAPGPAQGVEAGPITASPSGSMREFKCVTGYHGQFYKVIPGAKRREVQLNLWG